MRQLIDQVVSGGLEDLRGALLDGTLPVREELVQWIAQGFAARRVEDLRVRIGAGRRVEVSLLASAGFFKKRLKPEFRLPPEADLSASPVIDLELVSAGYGMAGALVQLVAGHLLPPGIRIESGYVRIDLSRILGVREYEGVWRHVRSLRFRSDPGVLFIDFEMEVA